MNGRRYRRWRRRVGCVLLSCLLWMAGCSTLPQPSVPSPDPSHTVSPSETAATALAYCPTDSLHPYHAVSQANRRLLPLLYEGLVTVDARWEAQPALATAWNAEDPTHLSVSLRQDARFSDGSLLTAQDVVLSFQAARACEYYRTLLQNVRAVEAVGDHALRITWVAPDPLALNALSFPVIRETEAGCVGTGPYRQDGAALVPQSYAVSPAAERWSLSPVYREAEMDYALESGAISYYFTALQEPTAPRTVRSVGQVAITQNTLVFLGLQTATAPLSSAEGRAALSAALSRKALCTNAFNGFAVPAATPFVPTWSAVQGLSGFSETENIAFAVAKWEELGYNNWDAELLVCADRPLHARIAAELNAQLQRSGILLRVVSLPRDEYLSRVRSGRFTLYLGELPLSADLSLRPLLQADTAVGAGIPEAGRALYRRYLSGELSVADFCKEFVSLCPFLPLCWRQGLGAYRTDAVVVSPSATNVYQGLTSLKKGM